MLLQVLSDPRQKRFFKSKDMRDLFTLGDEYANATETSEIFASVNGEVTATLAAEQAPLPELNHAEGGYGMPGCRTLHAEWFMLHNCAAKQNAVVSCHASLVRRSSFAAPGESMACLQIQLSDWTKQCSDTPKMHRLN